MKAVSSVVTAVLLLVVTVSLISTNYILFSKIQSNVSKTAESQINQTLAQDFADIRIDSISKNSIYVRNLASNPVDSSKIAVYIDDTKVDVTVVDPIINSQKSGEMRLAQNLTEGYHVIRVIAGKNSIDEITINVPKRVYGMASISGYVISPSSGGISGATVSCGNYSTTSSSDGYYLIGNINMSSLNISCVLTASKSPAFIPNSILVTVDAGSSLIQNIQLSYANATVFGYVRNSSGSVVLGTTVSCNGYSSVTLADGSYSIGNIAMSSETSSCSLTASNPKYIGTTSVTALLSAGATTNKDIQLTFDCTAYGAQVWGDYCLWFDRTFYCRPPYTGYCSGCSRGSGWDYTNFTMPPNYHQVLLNHAGFDDNGRIYLNGNLVFTEADGCCSAKEYDINPPINLTSVVRPGLNNISVYVDDCCGVCAIAIVYIIYN